MMPLQKDIHLKDGIIFPNTARQDLGFAIKMPDVKNRTEVLVRLSLNPDKPQANPVPLMDMTFEVFPASVTKELTDLLQPKPNDPVSAVVFGPGQNLRHFLSDLHVSFEDGGLDTPDRFDANRLYFGELATDEQFQQAQDRSAIPGAIAHHRLPFSIRENQLIEAHNRDVERGEISSKPCVDPSATVRIKLKHGAVDRGAGRNRDTVIDINGIKQAAFQGLPRFHRYVFQQLNRQWRFRRNFNRGGLAHRAGAHFG